VKCGDSLVGVADLRVLAEGIPDDAYKRAEANQKAVGASLRKRNKEERAGQLPLGSPGLDDRLLNLAVAADEIQRLADDSVNRVAEKAARYEAARGPASDWWTDATACHLWTAPFFADFSRGGDFIPTTGTVRRYLANPGAGHGQAVGAAWDLGLAHRFLHWPAEFPDVMVNGGFDAILGNPPFMGGKKISGQLGDRYRSYLADAYAPTGGVTDLCAYVYRRAFGMLRAGGHLGMVATNSIGQGDTREGGLALILAGGGTITAARRFVKWPGVASVEVNLLAIRRGPWSGDRCLDGETVPSISSRLDSEPEAEPRRLDGSRAGAFQGSVVLGLGFTLTPSEGEALIANDPRNRGCLFPYLNGEDLNSRPDQSPSRRVINFFDWPLEKAREFPDLLSILEQRVKPERALVKRDRYRTRWWTFAENCPGLYSAIGPLRRVLVRAQVSELHAMCFVPQGYVYSMMLVVYAFDDDYHFALLQSIVHEAWVWRHASSLESRNRYTPTDCFDTFPFPQQPSQADQAEAARSGAEYHEHRRELMLARNLGLTKTYNLFNRADCHDADIARLRELHAAMDRAILACYGWSDLDPGHDFHGNERGQARYTISPDARREVLRRLLELNLEVAAAEEAGKSPAGSR